MTHEQVIERLREALKKDPRKSPELAQALGWHPVSVRRFRSGGRGLGVEEMAAMAKVLGMRLEWKLINTGKMQASSSLSQSIK